jgi:hypothetical protein
METKKICPVLIIIFFIFGLVISGIIGYSLGLKKVKFVTEMPKILPKEVFIRGGEVTKIEGNTLYIKSAVIGAEVDQRTGEVETETLKINVNSATKINFLNGSGLEESEGTYEAKFEDIKVGSWLDVISLENIKNKKEFLASEITIFFESTSDKL